MNTLFQISMYRPQLHSSRGTPACRLVGHGSSAAEEVDLRAAAARARVAHLPEVVVGAELADALGGQKASARCSNASSSRGMPRFPWKTVT